MTGSVMDNNKSQDDIRRDIITNSVCASVIFIATYIMVMQLIVKDHSDYMLHTGFAEIWMAYGPKDLVIVTYPLWHLLVIILSLSGKIYVDYAAAVVTGLFNVITFFVLCRYFRKYINAGVFIPVITCMFLFMGPFYVPWYNKMVYAGQGTPNIWHNPTMVALRPIALTAFLMIAGIIDKYKNDQKIEVREWVIFSAMLVLSSFAKPCFAQIILPGLAFYLLIMLIKSRGKNLSFCIRAALAMIPCALVTVFQYVYLFYFISSSRHNGIEIAWFDVMSNASPKILISMLLLFMFPAFVMITNLNEIKQTDIKLVMCIWFSSFLEYAAFAEKGKDRYAGNFSWGYLTAAFLIYVMSMKYFLIFNKNSNMEKRADRVKIAIGWGLFFFQVVSGIYYYFTLTVGANMY